RQRSLPFRAETPGYPVKYATNGSAAAKDEERMGGIKVITTLYTIFFILIILIAIGSFFGVFDNPMIDPGM
ncbi:MAG: hypothetical protein ACRDJC_21035, partial [Thermomicrobiales bacterium]